MVNDSILTFISGLADELFPAIALVIYRWELAATGLSRRLCFPGLSEVCSKALSVLSPLPCNLGATISFYPDDCEVTP